ncbi:hypothetical protein V5O48_006563 [Marasmius crinis-equi]|uniref:Uncharacterized protein n=1 Tax=Marasmius crinis-equi TaxID=585013 RepID=A0ABR3FJ43_9AGAR
MTPFHALTSGDLPLLAGFHEEGILANLMPLGQSFDVQNPPPLLFFDAVGTSPALRHLHISVTGRFDSLQKSRSHWAFLTKLEIEVDRPTLGCVSSMQGLSRSCPLLRELTITRLYNPIQLDETVVEVSEWIHLREFTLILVRQPAPTFMSSLFNIFESFTAPSLTDLSLAVKPFGSRWDDESFDYEADLPFHNFIIRSQCQLNSLRLDMPFGENSLRKTLDLLSSLTSFTVDITHSPHYLHVPTTSNHLDGIVRALSPSTEFVVCPALKNLYITSCRPEDAVVLVNLIEARAMHNTKLETLRAKFWSLSRASVRVLNSALELGKSKGLGVKIEWEYRKEAFEFDDPHIYSSHPTHEVLVG